MLVVGGSQSGLEPLLRARAAELGAAADGAPGLPVEIDSVIELAGTPMSTADLAGPGFILLAAPDGRGMVPGSR